MLCWKRKNVICVSRKFDKIVVFMCQLLDFLCFEIISRIYAIVNSLETYFLKDADSFLVSSSYIAYCNPRFLIIVNLQHNGVEKFKMAAVENVRYSSQMFKGKLFTSDT